MRLREGLLFCWLVMFGAACSKKGPTPLTLEEIPGAMSNAFKSATMLVRTTSDSVIQQVQDKEYAGATIQLNALLGNTRLSEPQRDVSSAALQTLNQTLQELISAGQSNESAPATTSAKAALTQPDEAQKAAATLEHYLQTK